MRLRHKTPCRECPWRTVSAQGYLGGHSPEMYADAVQENEAPACHMQPDHGPDDPRTTFCAGALATISNACILPHKSPGAREASMEVGRRDDCFQHPAKFYEYHAGKPYVIPIIRRLQKEK